MITAYIWGTGDYAARVMEHIIYVNAQLKKHANGIGYIINGIVDSSKNRQGTEFYGYEILAPDDIDWNAVKTVIVAVYDHSDIDEYLIKYTDLQVLYWEDIDSEIPVLDEIKKGNFDLPHQNEDCSYIKKIISLYEYDRDFGYISSDREWLEKKNNMTIEDKIGAIIYRYRERIEDCGL